MRYLRGKRNPFSRRTCYDGLRSHLMAYLPFLLLEGDGVAELDSCGAPRPWNLHAGEVVPHSAHEPMDRS